MEKRRSLGRLWDHIVHPQRRGHGMRLTIALIIVVLSAVPIERNSITSLERSIFEAINGLPDALNVFFTPVMQVGGLLAVPVVALIAYLAFRSRRVALDLAMGGSLAWVVARIVKEVFARGRPDDLLSIVVVRGPTDSGYGFISGHAAVAAALATIAAAYLGPRGKTLVIAIAAVVAVARIYVGVHLPLDVAGGAAMGWAVGSLVHFLVLPEVLGDPDPAER